jgi:hypothetical protein
MDALIHGLAASSFDSLQPVIGHAAQNLDHLPVTVIAALQLAPDRGHGGRKHPVPERSAIAQRARFACQNRHIVPRVIDRLATPEGAGMFAHHHAILPDDDPLGIGMNFHRTSDGRGQDRVFVPQGIDPPDQFLIFVTIEPHGAGLRHRGWHAVEAIEAANVRDEVGALGLEHLPDRLVGLFHMAVRLGVGHAFVQQPGVQLIEALYAQARRKEPFPHQPDLVLDLTLLPARCGCASHGLDKVVAAHLQKAAVVVPLLAGEDRLHSRLRSAGLEPVAAPPRCRKSRACRCP